MESPFSRSHWSNFQPRPRYSQSFREVPVQRPAARPSPRVVSIPVHFVGSDRSRYDSALKIQKVFRGFLVRKSVKKIAKVKREVDEVEKNMSRRETVEAIRSDAKERLRLNETLMSLLLRLDSVRGVDSGVRDFRKAVIKKAIALQERIDAFVSGDLAICAVDESSEEVNNVESVSKLEDQAQQTIDSGEIHNSGEHTESGDDHNTPPNSSEILEKKDETTVSTDETMPNWSYAQKGKGKDEHEGPKSQAPAPTEAEAKTAMADVVDTATKTVKDDEEPEMAAAGEVETAMEAIEKEESSGESSETESEHRTSQEENASMEIAQARRGEEGGGDDRRSKEMMEKMVEDNEKLMELMSKLYEKNVMQSRVLSSLSQRVEQLERAFMCEKLRKKKKQRRHCCGNGTNADYNYNCGNRF